MNPEPSNRAVRNGGIIYALSLRIHYVQLI